MMKRKFYTYLMVGVTVIVAITTPGAKAQNQLYFRETFDPAGPSGDPGAASTIVDYAGSAGTWRFYGLWITTGTGCTNGAGSTDNRHIRATNNAGLVDTAYIISPAVTKGINEVRFVRSRTQRRYTIYKTTDTDINTTNWVLAAVIPKVAGFPVTVCQDSAVIINDANAKRVMIKFEKIANSDIDSIGLTSVLALPIKFGSISAQQANGFVKVAWTIQTEINTLKYEIEKSTDGRTFSTVGTVAASNAGKYSWTDNSVSSNDSYYRIKGVDKDGAVMYSTILKVNAGKKLPELVITPNPVQGHLMNIQMNNADKGVYMVKLYNNVGALVVSSTLTNETGAFSKSVELPASVTKGVYQLQLINGATRFSKTVIVQ